MKKFMFLIIGFMTINFGFLTAQTNKGNFFFGATSSISSYGNNMMSLGYAFSKRKSDSWGDKEYNNTTGLFLNLSPKAGYFLADNLAIGIDMNLSYQSSKSKAANSSSSIISLGPIVRYYIPSSKVMPYVAVGATFGISNTKIDFIDFNENFRDSSSLATFGAGIGLAVPIGDHVSFDIMARYNSFTIKDKDDNYKDVSGLLGLSFGFTVFLGAN